MIHFEITHDGRMRAIVRHERNPAGIPEVVQECVAQHAVETADTVAWYGLSKIRSDACLDRDGRLMMKSVLESAGKC